MLAAWLLVALHAPVLQDPPAGGPARGLVHPDEGYVGSDACRACHAENHASWHASFHRTMTQQPGPGTVLAPFRGATPFLDGNAYALVERSGAYFAAPVGPDGRQAGDARRLVLMTGSHHFQVYWMAAPGGELEQLPFVWLVEEGRWFPRKSSFLQPPGPGGLETDRWQSSCIQCHATNGTPDPPDTGATRVAELGISCEACHGPGERHVTFRRSPEGAARDVESGTDLLDPRALEHVRATQVCGQCHGVHLFTPERPRARWQSEGFAYRPGDDLAATRTLLVGRVADNTPEARAFLERNPHVLDEVFWPDGEVRVSGREYNGLQESPCYRRGEMSCLSCHELHPAAERIPAWRADQLAAGKDGPRACLACHAAYADPAALAAHTHHGATSSGSDCLNCHMPYTTFGLLKAIRSHTITSPDARRSAEAHKPSACNLCHLDRSLGWTAATLHDWYGHAPVELDPDRATIAASVLWALAGDARLRALAASALAWEPARAASGTGWSPYLVSTLLLDDYDAVRYVAQRAARLDPRQADFALDFFAPLERQRDAVRGRVLSDWLDHGLVASPAQRAAVLVTPEGKLDEATFRRLYAARDQRPVRLGE